MKNCLCNIPSLCVKHFFISEILLPTIFYFPQNGLTQPYNNHLTMLVKALIKVLSNNCYHTTILLTIIKFPFFFFRNIIANTQREPIQIKINFAKYLQLILSKKKTWDFHEVKQSNPKKKKKMK